MLSLNKYDYHDDICDYDDEDDDDDDADDADDDDDNNGANCRLSRMQHHCFYHPRQQTVVDDGLVVLDWVKSELGDSAAQVHVQLYIPHKTQNIFFLKICASLNYVAAKI